jgi:hypothetical protein
MVDIDVTGCISAHLPCCLSSTYDPVTSAWLPTGGTSMSWWKFWQAAIASACVTRFWQIGSNIRWPVSLSTFAELMRLENCGSSLSRIWKSPSDSVLMKSITSETVMQLLTICNRDGL